MSSNTVNSDATLQITLSFTDENAPWRHVKTHAAHFPTDESHVRDEVLATTRLPSKKAATSPEHGDFSSKTTPLIASNLKALQKSFKKVNELACQMQAIGLGNSPSCSHSQGSNPRSEALPPSRRVASSASSSSTQPAEPLAWGALPGSILKSGESQYPQLSPPTIDDTLISQEQLLAEVESIYIGIEMLEDGCIQEHLKQEKLAKYNNDQYQTLLDLYTALLHEYEDFLYFATQHLSATPATRRLPKEYNLPARLWSHGIQGLLTILYSRSPASLDYVVVFIQTAYSTMTLFLETVPTFEDTWTECLGDLARYRMAIEDSFTDKEIWAQVARQWYLKSANLSPKIGRLYHHLAILAHPDPLPQLLYYGKSLAVPIPFTAARESIMTLFEPTPVAGISAVITAVVRSHAIIFTGQSLDTFDETLGEIKNNLDGYIALITKKYSEQGYCLAISNCIALLGYGAEDNPLALLLRPQSADADTIMPDADSASSPAPPPTFTAALRLFIQTTKIHLLRIGDTNTLSFLHVTLVLIHCLAEQPAAASLIYPHFPWTSLVRFLNALAVLPPPNRAAIESPDLPIPDSGRPSLPRLETTPLSPPTSTMPLDPSQLDIAGADDAVAPAKDIFRPFPEEFAMQGLGFTADYFPEGWFADENVEPETHYLEAESTCSQHRPERIIRLGERISELAEEWMGYSNVDGYTFCVGDKARECSEAGGEGGEESGSGSGSESVD